MYKNIKSINSIQWPVYHIGTDNWFEQDGIVFIDDLVVDDLNRPGKSIGLRRLQSKRTGLFKLKEPLFSVKDILAKKKKHFISSGGEPFTYEKTGFQMIQYHLIKEFEARNSYSFLWVRDISIPFKIPRPPSNARELSWAGILYFNGHPWTVYDYSKVRNPKRNIKV